MKRSVAPNRSSKVSAAGHPDRSLSPGSDLAHRSLEVHELLDALVVRVVPQPLPVLQVHPAFVILVPESVVREWAKMWWKTLRGLPGEDHRPVR